MQSSYFRYVQIDLHVRVVARMHYHYMNVRKSKEESSIIFDRKILFLDGDSSTDDLSAAGRTDSL